MIFMAEEDSRRQDRYNVPLVNPRVNFVDEDMQKFNDEIKIDNKTDVYRSMLNLHEMIKEGDASSEEVTEALERVMSMFKLNDYVQRSFQAYADDLRKGKLGNPKEKRGAMSDRDKIRKLAQVHGLIDKKKKNPSDRGPGYTHEEVKDKSDIIDFKNNPLLNPRGWHGESRRHAAAAKGVETVIEPGKRADMSKYVYEPSWVPPDVGYAEQDRRHAHSARGGESVLSDEDEDYKRLRFDKFVHDPDTGKGLKRFRNNPPDENEYRVVDTTHGEETQWLSREELDELMIENVAFNSAMNLNEIKVFKKKDSGEEEEVDFDLRVILDNPRGWHGEPRRHAAAAKGVETVIRPGVRADMSKYVHEPSWVPPDVGYAHQSRRHAHSARGGESVLEDEDGNYKRLRFDKFVKDPDAGEGLERFQNNPPQAQTECPNCGRELKLKLSPRDNPWEGDSRLHSLAAQGFKIVREPGQRIDVGKYVDTPSHVPPDVGYAEQDRRHARSAKGQKSVIEDEDGNYKRIRMDKFVDDPGAGEGLERFEDNPCGSKKRKNPLDTKVDETPPPPSPPASNPGGVKGKRKNQAEQTVAEHPKPVSKETHQYAEVEVSYDDYGEFKEQVDYYKDKYGKDNVKVDTDMDDGDFSGVIKVDSLVVDDVDKKKV